MTNLQDRRVLITGASSGIGAYLSRELARRGARVGLLARRADRLEALADELRAGGAQAAWAVADVTDRSSLEAALEATSGELGGADIVVANAGYGRPEKPRKWQPGAGLAMYDTNLLGMLRTFDWALPRFVERGSGQLVAIASLASYIGFAEMPSYCGSKAAMRVHCQGLRLSLRGTGVSVTTICPGFVESELTAKNRFRMPFLWKTDRAARVIADAIERRRGELVFPWQMRLLVGFGARLLPTRLLEALLSR